MSSRAIEGMAAQYRAQLTQREAQDAQIITEAHARMVAHIDPSLAQLYKELDATQETLRSAQDDNKDASSSSLMVAAWLFADRRVLTEVKEVIARATTLFAQQAKGIIGQAQSWVRALGNDAAALFLHAAQITANPVSLTAMLNARADAGNKVAALFDGLGEEIAQKVSEAVHLGVSLGQRSKELADRIAQILDEPRWRALTIAKTELFQRFNDILLRTYQSNAHTVSGWTWNCRLSPRSCAACIALHGTIHGLDEVLQDHPNGQCFATPYVAGMELRSGVEWFAQQDEAAQRAILGTNVAYDLYATGKATLRDFIGMRHDHGYGSSVYQRSAKQIIEGK